MGYTAKFTRGARTLTIDGDTYNLCKDFAPPAISADVNIGTGTSQNRTGGGQRFGARYKDRQWSFSIEIHGTSEQAIQQAVRQLASILEEDSEEPLYFWYKGNTLPEPSWGQFGALKKYTVLNAVVGPCRAGEYLVADLRSSVVSVPLTLTVGPFAEGKRVHAAKASGAIYYHTGPVMNDGLMVNYTDSANIVTDPGGYIDWTATGGASILRDYSNANRVFGLPYSVRFRSNGVGTIQTILADVDNQDSLNVIYRTLDGGSALSWVPSIVGETPTATGTVDLGGGFYLYWARGFGAGLVAGTLRFANTSATVNHDQPFSYFSVCYQGDMGFGNMLGWGWSTGTPYSGYGTISAFGSASIPIASELPKYGAVAAVYSHTTGEDAGPSYIWTNQNNTLALMGGGAGTVRLIHGATGTIVVGTVAPRADRRIIVAYNPGTAILYHNGTAAGTVISGIATATTSLDLFVGNMSYVSLRGLTLYDDMLSASEVAQVNAEMAAAQNIDGPLEMIPFFWTKDKDNIVDNCNDSTRDNWGVLAGIPGDVPPLVELGLSQSSQIANHFSVNASPNFANPIYFYNDPTGGAMGSASGGTVQTISDLGTTVTLIGSCGLTDPTVIKDYVMGRDWYAVAHLAGTAAGTVSGYVKVNIGGQSYTGGTTTMVHGTAYTIRRADPVNVPRMNYLYDNTFGAQYSADLLFYASRSNATANLLVDFVNFLPGPLTYIQSNTAADKAAIIANGEALAGTSAYSGMHYVDTFDGRRGLDIRPNQYNNIVIHMGIPGSAYDIARVGTLDFYITPRWGLL